MSCNSCSNITLPGVAGPAGAPGAAGAAGNGIVSVSFQSTTNPGGTPAVAGYTDTYRITYTDATTFDYNIVNGTVGSNGTNGTTLLKSITSEVETASLAYSSVFLQSVLANKLLADEDTLKFEGTVLNTSSDNSLVGVNIQFAGTSLEIGVLPTVFDFPNIEIKGINVYEILVDIVRVSSSSVRIESVVNYSASSVNYANSSNITSITAEIARSSQVISGLNLVTTAYPFEVKLRTDSASRPTKLTVGKLYLLNK